MPMPISGAVGRGSSASLRNPCPSGTGLGTGDLNGTIILICDAAFFQSSDIEVNVPLALGLGLGLGLPVLLTLLWILISQCRAANKFQEELEKAEQERRELPSDVKKVTPYTEPRINLVSLLSNNAYLDFCKDTLSEKLKSELTVLHKQVGIQQLTIEARARGSTAIGKWIGETLGAYPGSKEAQETRIALPS
jgi:hypothetical protein